MGACGAVWGETAGHPALTHVTSYLTMPGGEGGREVRRGRRRRKGGGGEKERMSRRWVLLGACMHAKSPRCIGVAYPRDCT